MAGLRLNPGSPSFDLCVDLCDFETNPLGNYMCCSSGAALVIVG
uniref:Uncharacterized protein n=1 Tax=Anguilla anguilla TaxID=7936 RepID=A0A0E9QWE4_ANGAN